MTREEAITILENSEYELSNQVGSKYCQRKYEAVKMAIETLKQESKTATLDKIRAEIIDMRSKQNCSCSDCLDIIDKYKAESEE